MSKINPLTKNLNTFQNCTLTHNNEDFDIRTMEIGAVVERKERNVSKPISFQPYTTQSHSLLENLSHC